MTTTRKMMALIVIQAIVVFAPLVTSAQSCDGGALPSIPFKVNSASLSDEAKRMLEAVATQIKDHPGCKVKTLSYSSSSKSVQQRSWERVNAVISYLVEKQGISEQRLIFNYGESGTSDNVDLVFTTEQGPENVPAPHPYLRKITLDDLNKKPVAPKGKL
jgi:OOP family OmpA-OmpF porin